MIDVFPFAHCPVAVFGLGRSGLSAAIALKNSNADVSAWDDDSIARDNAKNAGINLVDLYNCNWKEHTTLVLSPGIPLSYPEPHKIVQLAKSENVEVVGDIELLARTQRDAAYIGITGTNGKSTTTALIGHIMEVAGREVEIGGNLGVPSLELDPMGSDGAYVLEMSSYQLDLTKSITFDVAILLNISPDHLDRHGGMEGYVKSKRSIFHRQTKPRTAIIGIDDKLSFAVYEDLKAADEQVVIGISGCERVIGGVYVINGVLVDDTEGLETPIVDLKESPFLVGQHNWQNAASAFAAAKSVGIQSHAIMACINSYPGLVHRQEPVAIVDGVGYVNDSKATNGTAAAKALACYNSVYWILGGRSKEGGLDATRVHLNNVRHAFLIGEASMEFSKFLNGKVPMTFSGDLNAAVTMATEMARQESLSGSSPIVLLSPAAASFDQFENFEARGDVFRDLVEALPGKISDPFEEPLTFLNSVRTEEEGQ
ncbi:MAG: UDP-N-acetylmuramoyl-L-alanine--D-glutamate ligase [Pseudomonadota bacterium]|nr:UDP-N-acetylmuramoyl-L-alanine--D-glutamate ligase [Pseudomonadota bacterium]